jgi:hypothetical protein
MELVNCSGFQCDELQTDFQNFVDKKKKVLNSNKTDNVRINMTFRRVRATTVAAEKQ